MRPDFARRPRTRASPAAALQHDLTALLELPTSLSLPHGAASHAPALAALAAHGGNGVELSTLLLLSCAMLVVVAASAPKTDAEALYAQSECVLFPLL